MADLSEEATTRVMAVAARVASLAEAAVIEAGLDRIVDLLAVLGTAHAMATAFACVETGAIPEVALQQQEKLLRTMFATTKIKPRFDA